MQKEPEVLVVVCAYLCVETQEEVMTVSLHLDLGLMLLLLLACWQTPGMVGGSECPVFLLCVSYLI